MKKKDIFFLVTTIALALGMSFMTFNIVPSFYNSWLSLSLVMISSFFIATLINLIIYFKKEVKK